MASQILRKLTPIVVLALAGGVPPAAATTIHVPSDSTSIQAALNGASAADTVAVAPGTYTGAMNRDLDFGGVDILLLAEQGPAVTIIDCEGAGRGFLFQSGETGAARVSGFTITGGSADGGGAVLCTGGSSPTLTGCVFAGNISTGDGGGISIVGSSPQIIDCLVAGNASVGSGGGLHVGPGSAATLIGSTLSANDASLSGGGVDCDSTGTISITNSIVWGNCGGEVTVDNGGAVSFACSDVDSFDVGGGGIADYLGDNVFTNPLFCNPGSCGGATVQDAYTLLSCSPALGANNDCGQQMGAFPQGCVGGFPLVSVPGDFPTIQQAIDAACPGATVEVAPGTYTGPGNKDLDFGGKDLTLVGLAGPDSTIIDCGNAGRGFNFESHETANSTVEGFSVLNGEVVNQGGAVRVVDASPTFRDCIFSGNAVSLGEDGGGGALFFLDASPEFESCLITGNYSAGGGGAVASDSTSAPSFLSCTISGNFASGDGGGLAVLASSYVTVNQTILWGNCADGTGDAVYIPETSDTLSIACSNFSFGDVAGVGLILTPDINVFTDPIFCGAPSCGKGVGGDFTLDAQSPCLAENNGCSKLIGARGAGCGLPKSAEILSITDVPNDQGRQVRITWRRSGLDQDGSPTLISFYEVYRLIDSTLTEPGVLPLASIDSLGAWDYLMEVPAHTRDTYSVIAPTLADSTILDGAYYSTFAIRAATGVASQFFDSDPMTGYSVDNLAPNALEGAVMTVTADGNSLVWNPSDAEDLLQYRVYRGATVDFVPSPDNLIQRTVETGYLDTEGQGSTWFYKVTAVDFSGNESVPALAELGSVAVTLVSYAASWDQDHVVLDWVLSDPSPRTSFRIERRSGAEGFEPLVKAKVSEEENRFVFRDFETEPELTYHYRVSVLEDATPLVAFEVAFTTPGPTLSLSQNRPNPFRSLTAIRYTIDHQSEVRLQIFDVRGRRVRTLVQGQQPAGSYTVEWDGTDDSGRHVAPGTFFNRLQTDRKEIIRKIVLLD